METLDENAPVILTRNFLDRFTEFDRIRHQNYTEIIDHVYTLSKDLPISRQVINLKYKKSDQKSLKYRKLANNLQVKQKDYFKAIQMFTKSIAYAAKDEYLSLAYSYRSALLFKMKYYKECLEDIDRALKSNTQENLKVKLIRRQQKSERLMILQKNYAFHCPLPEIENKNILIEAASDSVELQQNSRWGRHVVATKDIKTGDIISIERPYCQVVDIPYKYLHCHECLELCYNMIPCDGCSEALYCSIKCKEQAVHTYHKYECILFNLGLTDQRLFVRIALKGLLENKNMTKKQISEPSEIYSSSRYKEIHELTDHRMNKTVSQLYQAAIEPLIFYLYFENFTDIFNEIDGEFDKKSYLKELLVRESLLAEQNSTIILKAKLDISGLQGWDYLGLGIYAFYSMLNHSCNPNAGRVFYGSTMVIHALSDIKKGDQITVTYCQTYNDIPKLSRQHILSKHYYFTCSCEACVNNWPMFEELSPGKCVPDCFLEKTKNLLSQGNIDKRCIDVLLNYAHKIASSMDAIHPTQGMSYIRGWILFLLLLQGNKDLDF